MLETQFIKKQIYKWRDDFNLSLTRSTFHVTNSIIVKFPREISLANFVHRTEGASETAPIFRVCLPLPEAGWRSPLGRTRLPRRSCGRPTNRLRARRGFSTGLSRVAALLTHATHVVIPLSRCSRSSPKITTR